MHPGHNSPGVWPWRRYLPRAWQHANIIPLHLGLTNQSFQLCLPSNTRLFLRVGHPDPSRLGIDRATEAQLLRAAHIAGVSPPVLFQAHAPDLLVLPWLDEPSWATEPPPLSAQIPLLANTLATLHQAVPLPSKQLCIQAQCAHYLAALPPLTGELRRVQQAMARRRLPTQPWRPCHHDLNPANLLGTRPWLIDWEYGAAGQVGFELASLAHNLAWPDAAVDELADSLARHLPAALRFSIAWRPFVPWVDYVALLWALLQQRLAPEPAPALQGMIAQSLAKLA
ncbi:MAG: phosphotransferase [Aeromonas sp.]